MTQGRWSRALLGAVLTAGALAAAPPAHASPPGPGGPGGLAPGHSWKVTLLTGDVVEVRTVKGRPPLVSVTPAAGREERSFRKEVRPDGHVVVTPIDVAGLVGRVIAPELFDVTALVDQGYDDARSKDLPLIVQGGKDARPCRRSEERSTRRGTCRASAPSPCGSPRAARASSAGRWPGCAALP
ncbi:hypothetical protein ACFQY7_41830 [Actinomadura luteofluorescens]|uniref:hypothetical protein n=1 Tax=Actinomadura luteofluorescens TaxID=46163 RepID=UPI0036267C25